MKSLIHSVMMFFRVLLLLAVVFALADSIFFGGGGGSGGGGCCCPQPCCCPPPPPPPCCCPPPPCCCGGGGGGGLGGLFGRKKREVIGHSDPKKSSKNECSSPEINAIIGENLKNDPKEDSRRIHGSLVQKFPNETFTVFCSPAPSPISYVAQSDVYCVDGNGKQNCYVFQL
ncbi:hypothetical protein QR680_014071 [Steinernema hermaphroditum]|uniref:Ground-like domain-containing protein n=1 Tax=Steinernema hermaphroditum TaxID=289476 RepID=A0AA39I7L1_9BILA|nr:hypothetical protein QR680_014071 [Steinernema hermaphroditum]